MTRQRRDSLQKIVDFAYGEGGRIRLTEPMRRGNRADRKIGTDRNYRNAPIVRPILLMMCGLFPGVRVGDDIPSHWIRWIAARQIAKSPHRIIVKDYHLNTQFNFGYFAQTDAFLHLCELAVTFVLVKGTVNALTGGDIKRLFAR
jgi:hypothetical protein